MTLTRVAQRAGVSASTASRYLRGQLNVQPETAARIDAAVREVGYVVPAPGPGMPRWQGLGYSSAILTETRERP